MERSTFCGTLYWHLIPLRRRKVQGWGGDSKNPHGRKCRCQVYTNIQFTPPHSLSLPRTFFYLCVALNPMAENFQSQSVWLFHIFLILLFYGLLSSRHRDGEVSHQQRDYHADSCGDQNDIIGGWTEMQIPWSKLSSHIPHLVCPISADSADSSTSNNAGSLGECRLVFLISLPIIG